MRIWKIIRFPFLLSVRVYGIPTDTGFNRLSVAEDGPVIHISVNSLRALPPKFIINFANV